MNARSVPAYVLDASVAAKWFLPAAEESLIEEAVDVFAAWAEHRVDLLVPDLFWPELANIFWKAVSRGRMPQRSADRALAAFTQHAITTAPSGPLLPEAFEMAVVFQRPVYDCMYVALAVVARSPMITADERLVNALGSRYPVRWLGSWQLG